MKMMQKQWHLCCKIAITLFIIGEVQSLQNRVFNEFKTQTITSSTLFYDYFKKGPEKKEIGRLWKNIIFPGIYYEYADTKETLKTVKVETKTGTRVRNDVETIQKQNRKVGTYNVVDESTVPKIVDMKLIQEKVLKPVKKPANFVAPTPKKATTINLGTGISVLPDINKYPRPKKPIILYEYEASPDCKRVREACSMLDLTVEYRPCPGATSGFSDSMATLTLGRREVPFMVDNNPSMYRPQLFGADDILAFLFRTYGPGEAAIPASLKARGRAVAGPRVRANARPDFAKMRPLTLYGWEGAPFVKPVREALNELSLPHVMVHCAPGSQNRAALQAKKGLFQAPFLSDPNTGVEMFESAEIVKYLLATYTL
mmetsp:Transcript_453/g.657  ORF Transcript_453/g.657 Transcript_453/m.657 type:complete len:371 (+) Transcript_453:509-1621(+)